MLLKIVLLVFTSFSLLQAQIKITFVEDPFPPYVIGKAGKRPTGGITYKIVEKVMSKIPEAEPDFVELLPWKRALAMVKSGNIDAIMHMYKTKERQKDYYFTNSTYPGRTVLFYNPQKFPNGLKWNKLKDLAQYRLCYIEGAAVKEYFQEQSKRLGITFYAYSALDSECFHLLAQKKADAFVYLEVAGYEYIAQHKLTDQYKVAEKPVYSKNFYMAFSKKSEAHKLIPKINQAIKELKEEGTIQRILEGTE